MRVIELIFDSVDLLYSHIHKVGLKRNGSYTDSPNGRMTCIQTKIQF